MAQNLAEISDAEFDTAVLKADQPVVVDFWAPWCGPCKAIGPIMENLAEAYGAKVKFTKCNVDDNPKTPGKYGIKSIPTLLFFNNGELVHQITGMVAKAKLESVITDILAGKQTAKPFQMA
jgi:thioredoxin